MTSSARVELETVPCPMGCAGDDRAVLEGFDRFQGLPGRFQVVECGSCGLMRTNPRPKPETMSIYYGAEYQPYQSTRQPPRWTAEFTDRVLRAEAVPDIKPGRMLEIGCASGSFLERMSRRGWLVEGIEFSKDAAAYCASRGYRVHGGPLESAPDPEARYDLVAGWMVLEHLHDPVACLKRLASWSKPGGWLAVSVPNAGCFDRRIFKDAWFPLHLPNHLFHFTEDSLRSMLQLGGWDVDRILYQPNIGDLVASAGFALEDRRKLARVAKRMTSYPWWGGRLNLALLPVSYPLSLLRQTDRMTAWARKATRE